jgi:alkylation response protein AidB-like acyl-CoA dehydrogenase
MAATKGSFGTRTKIRDQEWLQMALAQAEIGYGQARAFYYEATRRAWAEMLSGSHPSNETAALLNLAQAGAVERCVEVVDSMYRAGGSASLYARNSLDRRLRDVHTMAQHTVLGPRSIAGSGKALLGA